MTIYSVYVSYGSVIYFNVYPTSIVCWDTW